MKFRDLLACTLDALVTKKWSNLITVLCMIITLHLVFTSAFMDNNNNFYKNRITKAIKSDYETTVNVSIESGNLMDEEYLAMVDTFINGIGEMEDVEFSGAYVTTMTFFDELSSDAEYKDINSACRDELGLLNKNNASLLLYSDFELFEMYGITYDDKNYQSAVNEGYIPVVAGGAYKGLLEEGDVLTAQKLVREGDEYKSIELEYKVIDVIEQKGMRWISPTMGIVLSETNTINLDYFFVVPREYCPLPADHLHSIYYGVNKNASVTAVNSMVRNLATEIGLHVSTKTVEDSIEEIETALGDEAKYTTYMYIAMVAVCIMSATTVNIVSLLFRKKEIGVYIANGVSIREIFGMTVLETFIKVLISCVSVFAYNLYGYYEYLESATGEILVDSLGIVWILGVIILIASSIIPVGYIATKQPREFLEECL